VERLELGSSKLDKAKMRLKEEERGWDSFRRREEKRIGIRGSWRKAE